MESISEFIDEFNNIFSISDDGKYAEELQLQEALEASCNMSTTWEASSTHDEASLSRICCQICTEDKEEYELFEIQGCSHSFCSLCISRHVEAKLQDNIVIISCPGEDCENKLELEHISFIIPPPLVARWEQKLSESSILPSETCYCPYCSETLINDNNEGIVIFETECPHCRRLFCAQCNVPWHHGYDCDTYKRSRRDKEEEDELYSLAEKNNWKKCPNCKSIVEKYEGCIHMTCRCKFEFCYICGSDWNDTHWETCQSTTSSS